MILGLLQTHEHGSKLQEILNSHPRSSMIPIIDKENNPMNDSQTMLMLNDLNITDVLDLKDFLTDHQTLWVHTA